MLANYTYSKSIDLATDVQLTDTPQDYLNPNLDRAVGDNDIRHRFVFSILAMRDGVVPPTINLDNPSVETPIDLVPHHARKRDIDVVLSNSFGFGGTNASLLFKRWVD